MCWSDIFFIISVICVVKLLINMVCILCLVGLVNSEFILLLMVDDVFDFVWIFFLGDCLVKGWNWLVYVFYFGCIMIMVVVLSRVGLLILVIGCNIGNWMLSVVMFGVSLYFFVNSFECLVFSIDKRLFYYLFKIVVCWLKFLEFNIDLFELEGWCEVFFKNGISIFCIMFICVEVVGFVVNWVNLLFSVWKVF